MEVRNLRIICMMLVVAGLLMALPLAASDEPARENEGVQPTGEPYQPVVPPRDFAPYNPPEPGFNGTPTLTPSEIHVTKQPGDVFTEDKILYMPEYPVPPKADVIFVLDCTNSMSDELANVKASAIDIMTEVRNLVPDTYFGVISHQDYNSAYTYCNYTGTYGSAGNYPYDLGQGLTDDMTAVQSAINALSGLGGQDFYESYARALFECYSDPAVNWRDGTKKFVVQFGDNLPHDCNVFACIGGNASTGQDPGRNGIIGDGDDIPIMDAINGLVANNICLIPLFSGSGAGYFDSWDCWAGMTGCQAFQINSDGTVPGGMDIADYIANAIGQEFGHINSLTLRVCDPAWSAWLTGVTPPAYTDVELDVAQNFPFQLEFTVPADAPPDEYCFNVCADGDGVVYAEQLVCITIGDDPDDCIYLDIGEVWGSAGDDIQVPVYIQDVTGWDIYAFEMKICWCDVPHGLIQYEGCSPGEVIINSPGWTAPACGICEPYCIDVAAAGATPLQGGGVLFYLNFHISENAKPGMCCDICFEWINIYDPEQPLEVCWDCGWVCIENCSIGGSVYMWYCRYDPCCGWERYVPMPGVRMHLSNCTGAVQTEYTGANGRYSFGPLEPVEDCEYCVDIDFCPVPGDLITPYDASLILQHVVCDCLLEDCPFEICDVQGPLSTQTVYPQMVAANTSCGGGITSYDASLILQYVVGLIPAFPCPDPWAWFLLNDCENCADTCPHTFDWVGVLIGDVSGPMSPALLEVDTGKAKVGFPRHFDDKVEVPLRVIDVADVYSIEFDLQFNSNDFSVISVASTGIASGFMNGYNADGNNLLIAMAGSAPINGSGKVCTITLQKLRPHVPTALPRVELVDGMFNEGNPAMDIVSTERGREIWGIGLAPATPNPFTKHTALNFSLPQEANVTLAIYNVNGQRVRTLQDGTVSAGQHSVTWDGLDDTGSRVARGVYFARMETADFSATEKIVMLR
jgi:hypothetical protein